MTFNEFKANLFLLNILPVNKEDADIPHLAEYTEWRDNSGRSDLTFRTYVSEYGGYCLGGTIGGKWFDSYKGIMEEINKLTQEKRTTL